ncbi:hypothetical protein GCM10007052_02390 [Halioglobus japonicus]|uniref:Glutathione S-transferase n=1 Tax=Halioglobus japonicus TaxID=930805 RepID=A0AAP8SPP1_9GAMM|nr:glutathione S-transferase domain-containing protein [Halioglobus japonicus]PLW87704.1 hypothetical protein C0029_03770 [Halioglobus japonicus]GHD07023.1 hypothetical protein GCM10007052_02390 [Halioglobus japonicus]
MRGAPAQQLTFFGVEASPYQLKMQALADGAGVAWRRLPAQGSRWQNTALYAQLGLARTRGKITRVPALVSGMDEYPSVPFYRFDGEDIRYDSSGLGRDLALRGAGHLVPEDPVLAFVCRLLDEAFDEFGLYMVHHHRWVNSAHTNKMGDKTAAEMSRLLPPGFARRLARELPQRQVRRCPYLFSVAPSDYDCGMPLALTPPSREGFPSTHTLLDQSWRDYLAAMESLLAVQPYLLGDQFSLADASAYGQLAMNLGDGRAEELMREIAPRTHVWLQKISMGEHGHSGGESALSEALGPLLDVVGATFIPLMAQNAVAYDREVAGGQTKFNESAFDSGEALYDGELRGFPFRAVVKTFQVQVWREIGQAWAELSLSQHQVLLNACPALSALQAVCEPLEL